MTAFSEVFKRHKQKFVQKFKNFKNPVYSSPRAAAVLWQGNSNYYACRDADTRHKQTPVNHHFRSIPVSLQGSTWTNLRLGVVLAV
jgi:hypothetical protein